LESALQQSHLESRLPGSELLVETFNRDGTLGTLDTIALKRLTQTGMLQVFATRNGMVTAPHGTHFVKPSGKHCDRFIRTGNVIVSGAELDFIAFCCLPYIPPDTRHVYCDTGSIVAVGLAISALLRLFSAHVPTPTPHVGSFGSYDGLTRFTFREAERSVVLISASTSGELHDKLLGIEPGLKEERIVTLYGLGSWVSDRVIVCDLTTAYDPIQSLDKGSCTLCHRGLIPIPMSGEQFLPLRSKLEARDISADSVPTWLNHFMDQVVGTEILRVNYKDASQPEPLELFLDLNRVFADNSFANIEAVRGRFERIVTQALPLGISKIITLNNESSKRLGRLVQEYCAGHQRDVALATVAEVEKEPGKYESAHGATVVVASAVATGRSLLAASQVLRQIQKNCAIVYLVGIVRTDSKEKSRALRTNATYEVSGVPYGFHALQELFLPPQGLNQKTHWHLELEFLTRLAETNHSSPIQDQIAARIALLQRSTGTEMRGLTDDLFWPTSRNKRMSLRRGFALWKFKYEDRKPSQADIYFTVAALIHHMRSHLDGGPRLGLQPHAHTVIKPDNFERFNDGVIQAALLRAARPDELDYGADEEQSQRMQAIVTHSFKHAHADAGEAAIEFALALGMGRMTLDAQTYAHVVGECENQGYPEILVAMLKGKVES
jgi:hypothetical protein